MALLHILNRKYGELAMREAAAVTLGWDAVTKAEDWTVFFARARAIRPQLALTRAIVRVWSNGHLTELDALIARTRIEGSYRVSLLKQVASAHRERDVAARIHAVQRGAKVDLKAPQNHIAIVLTSTRAFIGELVWTNPGGFRERRSHLLPRPHPSGMDPALARALVNLCAAERIHDPFCGAGGILIEAGLAGMRVSGADIDPAMLDRAAKNLARFGIDAELSERDATRSLPKCEAIVTDLPYGKSTRPVDEGKLLAAFLERAHTATRRIVIGTQLPPRHKGWRTLAIFPVYIHKGMTRRFYALEAA